MSALLQYALETTCATGLIYLFYRVALYGRIPFLAARIYLLGALFAGCLIPMLKIPVWPGEVIWLDSALLTELSNDDVQLQGIIGTTAWWKGEMIGWIIELTGATILFLLALAQCYFIRNLRHTSERQERSFYSLFLTLQKIPTFSFLRSIYMWRETPPGDFSTILSHEESHIRHHHSIERLVAELFKLLYWWNPFVWILCNRLIEIEEYEADRDVLDTGIAASTYMTTLLHQHTVSRVSLTNNLSGSLIKRRFLKMTSQERPPHTARRLYGVLPLLLVLICLFSFTKQPPQYHIKALLSENEQRASQEDTANRAEDIVIYGHQLHDGESEPALTLQTFEHAYVGKPFRISYVIENISDDFLHFTEPQFEGVKLLNRNVMGPHNGSIIYTYTLLSDKPQQLQLPPSGFCYCDDRNHNHAYTFRTAYINIQEAQPTDTPAQPAIATGTTTRRGLRHAEVMPRFEGGDLEQFRRWVMHEIRFTTELLQAGSEGTATASFLIDEEGQLLIQQIEAPHAYLADEITSVLQRSPRWTPGSEYGLPVAVQYTLPISFRILGEEEELEELPLLWADKMAQFEGGDYRDFIAWFNRQLTAQLDDAGNPIDGLVVASFVIDERGALTDVQVLRSPDKKLSGEVKRILAASPKWDPGIQDGEQVRLKYILPVQFGESLKKRLLSLLPAP